MKKLQLTKLPNLISNILWGGVILLILSVLYWYINGYFPSGIQVLVSITALTIGILILKKQGIVLSSIFMLGIGNVLLLLFWGIAIPYISLLPLVVSYLGISQGDRNLYKYYLVLIVLINILEFFGVLPILKDSNYEVGPWNYSIYLLLEIIVYATWSSILMYYTELEKISDWGLTPLLKNTKKKFFVTSFIKGLYVSLLFHFVNNILQSIVWSNKLSECKYTQLRLIAESDREDQKHDYSIHDVIRLSGVTINNNELPEIKVSTSTAKLIFLVLANIQNNYNTHNIKHSHKISLSKDHNLLVSFIAENGGHDPNKNIWCRNLGTIKQLLQITGIGDINIKNSHLFITKVSFLLTF